MITSSQLCQANEAGCKHCGTLSCACSEDCWMAGNADARLYPSEAKPGARRADQHRASKLAAGCLEKVAC